MMVSWSSPRHRHWILRYTRRSFTLHNPQLEATMAINKHKHVILTGPGAGSGLSGEHSNSPTPDPLVSAYKDAVTKPAQPPSSRKTRRHEAAIAKKLNDKVTGLVFRFFHELDRSDNEWADWAKKVEGTDAWHTPEEIKSYKKFHRDTVLDDLDKEYKNWVRARDKDYNYAGVAGLFLAKVVEVSKTRAGVK